MSILIRMVVTLCWAMASAAAVAGQPSPESDSRQPRPGDSSQAGSLDDTVGLLYSSQTQFGPNGTPLVTVGIMDGKKRVSVGAADGLELSFRVEKAGGFVDRVLSLPRGGSISFDVLQAIPARVAYWCGVESIPFGKKESLEQGISQWRQREGAAQVFEVGSVFGIQGHVIDNRTYIIGVQSFETEATATTAAEEFFGRYGSRTFVHPHLTRRPAGRIQIKEPGGKTLGEAVDIVQLQSLGKKPIKVASVEFGQGYAWHGFEDRQFAGELLITLDRNGLLAVVNRLSVDRLLEGLVPSEIYPNAPMEALKAQAVVARGEVLAKIGARHFLEPFRLCSSTHCQVYAGVKNENARTSHAVRSTQGEFLFRGSDLVDSVYSASCGGHTENNDAVWAQPPSQALRGRPDMEPLLAAQWQNMNQQLQEFLKTTPAAFCNKSSFNRPGLFRWSKVISASEMDALIDKQKPVGRVMSIQVLDRGVSGRVKVVRVVGSSGDLVVQREWPIRQLLGNLKSGMFEVSVETDDDQMPKAFRFLGGGWGHGAGMCQIGAIGMAEHGYDYRQILGHYFNQGLVVKLYGGSSDIDQSIEEPSAAKKNKGTPLVPDEE